MQGWSAGRRRFALVVSGIVVIGLLTALFYALVMDIGREIPSVGEAEASAVTDSSRPVVRLGVISRYPPTVIYRGYQPIMDYLSASTPYRFELQLSEDYNDALQQLITGRVAAVFLGSYLYVRAHQRYGVVPILKPLNENFQPLSRSVLFVASRSPIREVRDLAGRSLALPSAESFSGNWLSAERLAVYGLRMEDLRAVRNFSHHNTVIAQVLRGAFDAGVTREHLVKRLVNDGLRVILYSDPIPSSPIAVAPGYDRRVVGALQAALLAVNRDEGRRNEITRDWDSEFVNGFVEATDEDYAIIRKVMSSRKDPDPAGAEGGRP